MSNTTANGTSTLEIAQSNQVSCNIRVATILLNNFLICFVRILLTNIWN